MRIGILFFCCLFVACTCKTPQTMNQNSNEKISGFTPQFTSGPPTLVYKTVADYDQLVPVILSEDKKSVLSYPHPADVLINGTHPFPTKLNGGYLLDNRGIGQNVAFLNIGYEEYAKLQNAPSPDELLALIKDKNPLIELCDCGNRHAFQDVSKQLNKLIDTKSLRTKCKVLK
ncbi:MAG: hypothetical protein JPMHGGIA_02103 [Saprospiraceae bacterium]|nr:hypothetical protein [Saprospiraceae bacterium]